MSQLTVATLGDSVAWGQGLRPQQKFNRLAVNQIANVLGISAGQVELRQNAHSGAVVRESNLPSRLDPNQDHMWPEVPWSTPTVFKQVAGAADASVDLVLLTAGINDIGFGNLMDPTGSRSALERALRQNFYHDIKQLLQRSRERFPEAVIVVTGYYPLLSEQSDLTIARVMVSLLGAAGNLVSIAAAKRVARRMRFFARWQLYWLRLAVTEKHEDPATRGPGILFAHPALGPQHSVGAPRNLLFSPQPPQSLSDWWRRFQRDPLTETLQIEPDDPMAVQRRQACDAYGNRMQTIDKVKCSVAAIGHPNPDGARRYAEAIVSAWQRNHRISLREDLDKLRDTQQEKVSLRSILQDYGLDEKRLSVRDAWQHMRVDSLAVEIHTGSATFAGTNHDVYLKVAPGRKFLLNEKIYDGDLFDDFQSGSTTRYALDPAEGDPGNRLHLADIEELSLVLQLAPSLPTGPWKPEWLKLEINGKKVFRGEIRTSLKVSVADTSDAVDVGYPG